MAREAVIVSTARTPIGRFLGGVNRPVTLVDVDTRKRLDLEVVVPLEDMANPPQIEEPPSGGSVRSDGSARSGSPARAAR